LTVFYLYWISLPGYFSSCKIKEGYVRNERVQRRRPFREIRYARETSIDKGRER